MIISWNVTKRCNLYCDHCYRDSSSDYFEGELSTEEGKKLISEISRAGFKILILSGGEPLMRKDLKELISFARESGLIPVIGTNGTLIDKKMAASLKDSGLRGAGISLDYLDAERHDRFRGVDGSFEKTLEGIKHCIDFGIKVQINTTVTKHNKDQILKITDFARKLGAKAHHPFFLVEVGRGKNLHSDCLEDKEYLKTISEILDKSLEVDIEMKPTCGPQFMSLARRKGIDMRFSRGCLAGVGYCCILPDGEVHICPYLPIKAGNVRDTQFDKLWEESEIFNRLRDYSSYTGNCGGCKDISICGGCRARAYNLTGDYMGEDPISGLCKSREVE
jgi:AdoMet-dependent heme synthase